MPVKHWLLKLVSTHKYGNLLTAVLAFALLYPLFRLGVSGAPEHRTPAVFFALVIAYIVPVFSYITQKAQEALTELRPLLDLDEAAFEGKYALLSGARPRILLLQLVMGAAGGIIHWSSLEGSLYAGLQATVASLNGLMSTLGTILTWVVMTSVIFMLIQQAVVFARLGAREVQATPFNLRRLTPFARVSISASLATIGALALFPLMSLEGETDLQEILPGAIAMAVPLVAIFLLPVWPLHRRLANMKQRNLADIDLLINQSLDQRGFIDANAERPERLNLLLTYRRELEECATWPFDLSNFARLALYLIIPPLTWVAAALIENLVDSVI